MIFYASINQKYLCIAIPRSSATFGVDDEFMLGPSMLVCPVSASGASSVEALLPKGVRWYCAHSGLEKKLPGATEAAKLQVGGPCFQVLEHIWDECILRRFLMSCKFVLIFKYDNKSSNLIILADLMPYGYNQSHC